MPRAHPPLPSPAPGGPGGQGEPVGSDGQDGHAGQGRPTGPSAPERPDELGDLFLRAARRVRRRHTDVLEPWGLSPHEGRALGVVGRHEPVRPGVIAQHLRIAPRSVTDVLDALEQRGLVERSPDPDDRRALVVRLTEAGLATMKDIGRARRADLADFFGVLSEPDRATLTDLLIRLDRESDQPGRRVLGLPDP